MTEDDINKLLSQAGYNYNRPKSLPVGRAFMDMYEWALRETNNSETPFQDLYNKKKEAKKKEKQHEEGDRCDFCHGVLEIDIRGCYCANGNPPCGVCEQHSLLCRDCGETYTKTEETEMTLYYIEKDGKEVYGNRLATGSDGLAIFEERGTNVIHKVKPSEIKEVMPYTYAVKYVGSERKYHYYGTAGSVKVGDLLMNTLTCNDAAMSGGRNIGGIAEVVELDTKNKGANKWFTGYKLAVEKLEVGETE